MTIHFEKDKFTGEQLEQAIIELFKAHDYDYVQGEKHRQYNDILLLDDLRFFD